MISMRNYNSQPQGEQTTEQKALTWISDASQFVAGDTDLNDDLKTYLLDNLDFASSQVPLLPDFAEALARIHEVDRSGLEQIDHEGRLSLFVILNVNKHIQFIKNVMDNSSQ
jgi:hypothetical protein